MVKAKLDIKKLIHEGKIGSAKAGELLAADQYEHGSILTPSEETALRQTAKDTALLNYYIYGANELTRREAGYMGTITEIDRDLNYFIWYLSEVKQAATIEYREPRILIVTEKRYKEIAQEKHQARAERLYTLVTLYRAIAEDIVFNRADDYRELVTQLDTEAKEGEKQNPKNLYGIELLKQGDDVYKGWTGDDPKYRDYTLADFAEDLPSLHEVVMRELATLYRDKKIPMNPETVPLEAYLTTPIKGEALNQLEIQKLKEWFRQITGWQNPLDTYDQPQYLPSTQSEQQVSATRYQEYAILQNPSDRDMTNGVATPAEIYHERLSTAALWRSFGGERLHDAMDDHNDYALLLAKKFPDTRAAIIRNLKRMTIYNAWRARAGKLLGIDRGDNFIKMTVFYNLDDKFVQYETWRMLYNLDDVLVGIVDPQLRDYIHVVQEGMHPLVGAKEYDNYFFASDKAPKTVEQRVERFKGWIASDKDVAKCLDLIEDMELGTIVSTYKKTLEHVGKIYAEAGV